MRDDMGRALLRLWREHDDRLERLECQMSETTDALGELNDETTALAERIDAILENDSEVDTTTATELRKVSNRLKGLAATEGTPVPPVEDADQPADLG